MESSEDDTATTGVEEETRVLGASGMLRQFPEETYDGETLAMEKTSEDIDVEGNSDDEVEDAGPIRQELEERPGPLQEADGNCISKKLAVAETSGSASSEQRDSRSPSDRRLEKKTCSPVEEFQAVAMEKAPEVRKPEEGVESEALKFKTEKGHLSENATAGAPETAPGTSSVESLENPRNRQVVAAELVSDVKAVQKTQSVTQPKERMAGPDARDAPRAQKLKSFEDAFKASLTKLNVEGPRRRKPIKETKTTSKPVDGASQRPPCEAKQQLSKEGEWFSEKRTDATSVPEKTETGARSSPSLENHPGGGRNTLPHLKSSQKPASCGLKDEAKSSDDEGDNSRDVDNFSTDSSSTIIDIEMATKESTEEEMPGKLDQASPWRSKDSREALAEEANSPIQDVNPTSATTPGGVASDKTTRRSAAEPSKADTSEVGRKRRISSQSSTHPVKSRELGKAKSATTRQRERSKSDETQNVAGKKYRISKHGIILQPGVKLEAMDYSKKWYLARIVSVDETDSTVLIHFAGWNSRFDEWLEFDSDRLRPQARVSARRETAKEVKALGGYKIGDEVLARWSDCRYYPAKILGIKTNGSYRVLFYDGIEKIVMGINVRDMPESLKSQQFFSNLEHQFRALLNKKRRGSKDSEGKPKERRLSQESAAGSRPSSPVPQPQKRRHPSASQTSAGQPAKRSRPDSSRTQKGQKGNEKTPEPVPVPPSSSPFPQEPTDLLPSPTSSEASELMSALEHGLMGGNKRYREPLIFDKNSGLIRDPRRLVAPKELVIDLDHNKYKCDVPDCGKAFRKASLLEYHKKYYHVNKPATSTSAMAAAKNALTRSRKRLSTSVMAPGTSKMRRTESLDAAPAKVTSRPMRASAPSILTTSYKRPLSSAKLEGAAGAAAEPAPAGQFAQKPKEARQPLSSDLPSTRQPTLPAPKSQGSEVATKAAERSRRVSGSSASKEDRPTTSKWEVTTTTVEKPATSSKAAASTSEVKIKTEPGLAPASQKPETKSEQSGATHKSSSTEVKEKAHVPTEVVGVATPKEEGPKKSRRNKQHKKHKRHKARSRDRRSREQSRSERRRAAERAKQRRLEQRQLKQQFEASAAAAANHKPEDVMEWTAKYLPVAADKHLARSPAQSADSAAKPEVLDSSTTEDGGPRDMINCVCRNQEEEGFMIQCEACYGWQHGGCVGLTEHTVPKQYICSFCIFPENLRTHARHRYDQEWFCTGRLPTLTQPAQPEEESGGLTESMLKTHQLMADMIHVTEVLDGLQRKLEILKSDNHPDLKLWSHHWGLKDESTPLDDSAHSQQLHTSLEESDIHLTSAETSALTVSMQSDVVDGVAAEEVVAHVAGPRTSDADTWSVNSAVIGSWPGDGVACETGQPHEGGRPLDRPTVPAASNQTSVPETREQGPQRVGSNSVEADIDKTSAMPGSKSETDRTMEGGSVVSIGPDKGTPLSSEPKESQAGLIIPNPQPTTSRDVKGGVSIEDGKPGTPVHDGKLDSRSNGKSGLATNTAAADTGGVPVQATEEKDSVTGEQGEPGTQRHRGKVDDVAKETPRNDGDSSDDEPLKYAKKSATSSETESETALMTVKVTSQPSTTPTPAPVVADGAPSVDRTPPAGVCKLNLFNHIVCVEEELKRRMDFVEEQIEALELAFNQSAGGKDSPFVPPEPLQMKRTIGVIMEDLERVNKLVSL